ncbi:MAG: hypothetical protein RL154_1147, partial [Pseudomonadota bacterium]
MVDYLFLFQNYLVAICLIAPILGYGFLTLKLLKSNDILKTPILNIFLSGLLGLCALSIVTIILNFIIPISKIVSLTVLFIGFLLFVTYFKNATIQFTTKSGTLFLAIFFFTFTISQIGYPNFGQDTSGYHIQCVKWFEESTVPIGIAELNLHFALNNAIFALGAIFDVGYFKNTSIFITNGFFVFFWIIGIVYSLTTKKQLSSLYMALSIIILELSTYKFLGNLYSELSTAVISITLIYLLILYSEKKQYNVFKIIVALAMFGATLKLSMIVFGIVTILVAIIFNPSTIKRNFLSSLLISLIIIIPWICRNIYMSGMIIFPINATALPLEWTIDSQTCKDFAKYVMDWA